MYPFSRRTSVPDFNKELGNMLKPSTPFEKYIRYTWFSHEQYLPKWSSDLCQSNLYLKDMEKESYIDPIFHHEINQQPFMKGPSDRELIMHLAKLTFHGRFWSDHNLKNLAIMFGMPDTEWLMNMVMHLDNKFIINYPGNWENWTSI